MRMVPDTPMNPEWVLSAMGHMTACTSTKMMLGSPSPSQMSASSSSAIAGRGFSIAVSVSRRSLPSREAMARMVSTSASTRPIM